MRQKIAQNEQRLILRLIMCVMLFVITLNAWLGDDMYITMRTVWNFLNGHGLTWNIGERVQAYTHPLWMFVLSAAYAITSEDYFTIIILNMVFSLLAIYLLLKRATSVQNMLLAAILLVFSKAFIDYTTSGLENALSYLLMFLIVDRVCSNKPFSQRSHFITISLLISLLICNRTDLGLIVFPVYFISWLGLCIKEPRKIPALIGWSFVGFSPLILWELFSLFYYGFLFPNTAYAKLNTGIEALCSYRQGLSYYFTAIATDSVTMIALFFGVVLVFLERKRKPLLVGIGVILYLLYLLKIGGDFMGTRLLSIPMFTMVILISQQTALRTKEMYVALAIALFLGIINPYNPLRTTSKGEGFGIHQNGIADERTYFFKDLGLINYSRFKFMPDNHPWYQRGYKIDATQPVYDYKVVGMTGFAARDAGIHIIDRFALCDPLLARMPVADPNGWRIGHFERNIPEGYVDTLTTGTNSIRPHSLAKYYDHLTNIISGKLLSASRFEDIANMNLGHYDQLLNAMHLPAADFRTKSGQKRELPGNTNTVIVSHHKARDGYFAFGVYKTLPPGDYEATFSITPRTPKSGHLLIDIVADKGRTILASQRIDLTELTDTPIQLPFSLERETEVEPRIQSESGTAVMFDWCDIDPVLHP